MKSLQWNSWQVAALAGSLWALAAMPACADDEIAATPYRPTVANPAELPVPGWLEIEAGGIRESGSGVRRYAMPYTAKLAFNADWGVLVGGDLWARQREDGDTLSGHGDTAFTLKHRMALDEQHAFGFEAGVNLPTARDGLDSGKPDWTLTGIYSVDFAKDWRLDLNLGATRIGAPDSGEGRVSEAWAASMSHTLGDWTLAGELSGSHQAGASNQAQALAAASYAITPRVVVDAGFSLGREEGDAQHTLFLGVTWLAGKLF